MGGAAARLGLAGKGVVFAVIGVLALQVATGSGGKTTNQKGALETVANGPFGKAMLIILAIALAGYALWRFTAAWLGRSIEHGEHYSAGRRLAYVASGLVYAFLFASALSILFGSSSGSSGGGTNTGWILSWPGGQWILFALGVVMIGVGIQNGWRGWKEKFLEDFHQMGHTVRIWVARVGKAGLLSRMVVFAIIGVLLCKAALDYSSKQIGLDDALRKLAQQSYGPWLLGVIAVGLIAYAAYCFAGAKYREV